LLLYLGKLSFVHNSRIYVKASSALLECLLEYISEICIEHLFFMFWREERMSGYGFDNDDLIILRQMIQEKKEGLLLQMLTNFIQALQQEGYHFSDVLRVEAIIAEEQAFRDPDEISSGITVARYLRLAAEASEQEGRELP